MGAEHIEIVPSEPIKCQCATIEPSIPETHYVSRLYGEPQERFRMALNHSQGRLGHTEVETKPIGSNVRTILLPSDGMLVIGCPFLTESVGEK